MTEVLKTIDIFSRGRLMREIARTEKQGRSILVDPKVRLITIHDTLSNPAFKPIFKRHLILCFDDITPGFMEHEYPTCRLCTPQDAKATVQYAQKVVNDPVSERLIVNCEAGISRSSGVATAIAEIFNVPQVQAFQGEIHPNSWVRRLMFEEARRLKLIDFPRGSTRDVSLYDEDNDTRIVFPFGRPWSDTDDIDARIKRAEALYAYYKEEADKEQWD